MWHLHPARLFLKPSAQVMLNFQEPHLVFIVPHATVDLMFFALLVLFYFQDHSWNLLLPPLRNGVLTVSLSNYWNLPDYALVS